MQVDATVLEKTLNRIMYRPNMVPVLGCGGMLAPSPRWMGGPDLEEVIRARQRAWQSLGGVLGYSVWCAQTHSNRVHLVENKDIGAGSYSLVSPIRADALVYAGADKQVSLVIKSADCVTAALWCTHSGVKAVFHAGTRGQMNGIVGTTVDVMLLAGARKESMMAFVGPFIRARNYRHAKYGETVRFYREQALAYRGEDGHWHVDQEGMIRRQLYTAGIPFEQTFFDGRCTFEECELESHVRSRRAWGQMGPDGAFQRGNNIMVLSNSFG